MTVGEKGSRFSGFWKTWSGGDRNPWEDDTVLNPHYYYLRVNTRNIWTPWRDFPDLPTWSNLVSWDAPVVAFIQNSLVSKMRELATQQQYLADLYEAKSTVDLVKLQLMRLLKMAKKLKKMPQSLLKFKGWKKGSISFKPKKVRGKGPRKNVRKVPRPDMSAVPSAWLEFWFAAMPTVGSIAGLADTFNVPFDWEHFRFTTPKDVYSSVVGTQPYDTYNLVETSAITMGEVRVKNHNTGVVNRMGLGSFLSTAWEVAPWSWAIDYFANIGDLFANLDGLFDNFEFRRQSTTYRVQSYVNRAVYQGEGLHREVSRGWTLERWTSVPLRSVFQFNMGPNLKQTSYLLSAIALTLKGKMS